jgi:CheY-like chemotaxis protein
MTGSLKILCVDDDPDIRTIAVMALGLDPGLMVRAATSGPEALLLLRSEDWRPDAILLDVMMPGMDGPSTLAAIRSLGGFDDMPILFMTARAAKADLDGYRTLGATGVIVKPFDPLHLAEDVRALIDSRL